MSNAAKKGGLIKNRCEDNHDYNGTNETGSGNVFINGENAHRKGDGGKINCPYKGEFTTNSGSGTVFINNKPAARVNDTTFCNICGRKGYQFSGSNNVFIGD